MLKKIVGCALASSMLLGTGAAFASGQTTNKSYASAKSAALHAAAFRLNQNGAIRNALGTIRAKRLLDKGPVSQNGASTRRLVVTKLKFNGKFVAKTVVSVRKTDRGWIGYTAGKGQVTIAKGALKALGADLK